MMFAIYGVVFLAAAASAVLPSVIDPPVSSPSSSSSLSASTSAPPKACRPRTRNTDLFQCFVSSTGPALVYCSTAASVSLTPSTTIVTVEPTVYVPSIKTLVVSDISTVDTLITNGYIITSTSYTTTTTFTSTSTKVVENMPPPKQKRDVVEVRADIIETVTIKALLARTRTIVPESCVTAAPTVFKREFLTVKKRDLGKRQPSIVSGNPVPSVDCLTDVNPAPGSLTSVCSAFVTAYGDVPTPVTQTLHLPAVTLTEGQSTELDTVSSTTTRTRRW